MQNSYEPQILYIDDYQSCDKLVDALLYVEKFNCNLTLANTPREALRLIGKERFDLFVVESKLPEMNGFELCRRIRKTNEDTPILLLTKATPSFDQIATMALGAIEYLSGPYDLTRITRTIKNLLSKKTAFAPA